MAWQLPDIRKTITNNILPSSLSAYAVRIGRYSHSVDRRQSVISVKIPYRVALFPWIRIGLYILVGKNRFNSMNHVCHVLNYYFNPTNPQWRRRCKII